ncbi:hypothetical protein TIFTF001_001471 [Ficus carica]|uniref:Disease resistance N-terminal domain-containing protein n=1 Tax=Ficus carica TaxID=3494 RepID=A0AA87Z6V1_FICCA|nr:hypothetical protein TIFTF001_001471 [Ficus carica]
MEEAVVSFAIERLGDLLIAEAKFLYGVRGQVEDAKAKLQWMRAFLERCRCLMSEMVMKEFATAFSK